MERILLKRQVKSINSKLRWPTLNMEGSLKVMMELIKMFIWCYHNVFTISSKTFTEMMPLSIFLIPPLPRLSIVAMMMAMQIRIWIHLRWSSSLSPAFALSFYLLFVWLIKLFLQYRTNRKSANTSNLAQITTPITLGATGSWAMRWLASIERKIN